jgi:hypothetical protein
MHDNWLKTFIIDKTSWGKDGYSKTIGLDERKIVLVFGKGVFDAIPK